jgi:hypothetical protein
VKDTALLCGGNGRNAHKTKKEEANASLSVEEFTLRWGKIILKCQTERSTALMKNIELT